MYQQPLYLPDHFAHSIKGCSAVDLIYISVNKSPHSRIEILPIASFVWRISAVAEEYASQQPFLPQVHCSPSAKITIWPASPAASLQPLSSLPFTTIPLPTPVPRVTATKFATPSPAPAFASPSAAQLASFSR